MIKKIEDRFFSYVKYSEKCWELLGPKNYQSYGKFNVKNKEYRAHRWSYEYFVEPLGEKYCLHHCDNPSCVNPFHLFKGTAKDNALDMVNKKRHYYNKKKLL